MIWVIGDIHGRLDPLVSLLTEIRFFKEKTSKLIFLGDYINVGPSSKEVLDLLIDLPGDKVFLVGDHEDMLLRFIHKDDSFVEYYPSQWRAANPLADFYKSIFGGQLERKEFIQRLKLWPQSPCPAAEWAWLKSQAPVLPEKYSRFFQGLKYLHRESFRIGPETISFHFCHGLPRANQSLASLTLDSFADFNAYLQTLATQANSSFSGGSANGEGEKDLIPLGMGLLRGQEYDFAGLYPDGVIVHGHFPTIKYPDFFPQFFVSPDEIKSQFKHFNIPGLPFIFSTQKDAGYFEKKIESGWSSYSSKHSYTYNLPSGGFVSTINIDTGIEAGGNITAIGLSNYFLGYYQILFISVKSTGNYRMKEAIDIGNLLIEIPRG
jgi:hypothetical protein